MNDAFVVLHMNRDSGLPPTIADGLVRACKATVGGDLRSITYFDPERERQLYLRDDLTAAADIEGFAEHERHGFRSQSAYAHSELGSYRFTIRAFDRGYLLRVIVADLGAFVTTDELSVERFVELANAVEAILTKQANV
ncbi:MAG: hypothetical protein ACI8XM_001115 [Haloarculaceae archaeon]